MPQVPVGTGTIELLVSPPGTDPALARRQYDAVDPG